jgi:hypothetical protein
MYSSAWYRVPFFVLYDDIAIVHAAGVLEVLDHITDDETHASRVGPLAPRDTDIGQLCPESLDGIISQTEVFGQGFKIYHSHDCLRVTV